MSRRTRIPGAIESASKARYTDFNPASIPGLGLWYDWSTVPQGNLTAITDLSGAGRNGAISNGRVCGVTIGGRRMAILEGAALVGFSSVSVRTVIRALVRIGFGSGYVGHVLSDSSNYNFHATDTAVLHPTYANAAARNGAWRLNGVAINPTVDEVYLVGGKYIISGVTTSGLSQNRIGRDRSHNNNPFILMEDLVWTVPLTDDEIKRVETYLALKWGFDNYAF